jgi:cell filamentation protein
MDPYVYPDSNVLRNLRGIRDPDLLARFEMDKTTRRLLELAAVQKIGKFDVMHLQAIHRHIFQDVFDWAGKFRTVNISRSGQIPFALVPQILPCLQTLLNGLSTERCLAGLPRGSFCNRAAYYLGELNAIHPFREGNGRTQREWIRQLAHHNGFAIHWTRVTREQMIDASILSFQRGDASGLASPGRARRPSTHASTRRNVSRRLAPLPGRVLRSVLDQALRAREV